MPTVYLRVVQYVCSAPNYTDVHVHELIFYRIFSIYNLLLSFFYYFPPFYVSQNCFELYIPDNKDQVIKACKTEADGRVVEGNHTFYRISAPTAEEKDEWMNSIK